MCDCGVRGNDPDCGRHGVQADPVHWCTCGTRERCLVHDDKCECGNTAISYFDLVHSNPCEECRVQ